MTSVTITFNNYNSTRFKCVKKHPNYDVIQVLFEKNSITIIIRLTLMDFVLNNILITQLDLFVDIALFLLQNDLHRAMQKSQSALSQQLMILSATLLCLVFTR